VVAFVPVQEMSAAQGQASVAMAQTNFATVFAKDVVVRVEYRSWAASSAEESCLCIFGELVVALLWCILRRRAQIWIRHARITHAYFLSAPDLLWCPTVRR